MHIHNQFFANNNIETQTWAKLHTRYKPAALPCTNSMAISGTETE